MSEKAMLTTWTAAQDNNESREVGFLLAFAEAVALGDDRFFWMALPYGALIGALAGVVCYLLT